MMQQQGYGNGYGYGPPPSSQRQELPIFAANGVQVTSARFVCWNQTYPISSITSVSTFVIPANVSGLRAWQVLFVLGAVFWGLVFGAGVLSANGGTAGTGIFFGLACVVPAVLLGMQASGRKPSFGVSVATAGMNVRAVVSPDQVFVGQVVGALNHALSMR